jgi:hypothetical protein
MYSAARTKFIGVRQYIGIADHSATANHSRIRRGGRTTFIGDVRRKMVQTVK